MATGGARRGRRDNGLEAAAYAVVGDVDPRIGEHLLDVLGEGGIAAYLEPTADLHPITRTSTLPARPTDRLYADRTQISEARAYLSQLSADAERVGTVVGGDGTGAPPPAREPADIDAAWADIVAGFKVTVDPTAAPWPAAEGVPAPSEPTEPEPRRPFPRWRGLESQEFQRQEREREEFERRQADEPSLLDGLDTFGAFGPAGADDDEGYRPPPPPPLPRISSTAVASLCALATGILLLFWPSLLPLGRDMSMFLAFAALVGGFVGLVWRLRPGDEPDEDPDDGAVV
ncbi:MAG TPA: DUF308 domain-containing protein [Micromonosporaceae bacterium]|nr:DUF308 domain-containing protein [Micromonosporaceae bacterium]